MTAALEVLRRRQLPRTTPHVNDVHHARLVIDGEEHTIDVWLPPVVQHADGRIGVEALWCDRAPFQVVCKRQDDPLETVEPLGALLRRTSHNPEIQVLELSLRDIRVTFTTPSNAQVLVISTRYAMFAA